MRKIVLSNTSNPKIEIIVTWMWKGIIHWIKTRNSTIFLREQKVSERSYLLSKWILWTSSFLSPYSVIFALHLSEIIVMGATGCEVSNIDSSGASATDTKLYVLLQRALVSIYKGLLIMISFAFNDIQWTNETNFIRNLI